MELLDYTWMARIINYNNIYTYIILYYILCLFRACCIITYIFAAFFIILYGLKLGKIKSLCWLTVVIMAIFQGVLFSKPLKIILISGFVTKFNQKNMVRFLLQNNLNINCKYYPISNSFCFGTLNNFSFFFFLGSNYNLQI